MSEGLKPCPFCGGEANFAKGLSIRDMHYVRCDTCLVQTGFYVSSAKAQATWNSRVEAEREKGERG